MSVRSEYDKELVQLHKSLLKMGAYIEKSITDTIEAFENQDVRKAKEVIMHDDVIDSMETNIEAECLLLIARQQPIAGDLRMIASVLKIITDLERIADHCADISDFTIKLSKSPYKHNVKEIPNMALKVKEMIKDTIDAYVELDVEKAVKTAKEDDIVDDYFEKSINNIKNLMMKDSEFVEQGIYLLLIAKYLERMGDHATNVCEWIAYRVTGNRETYN